jgi:DNA polymerase-3 subunit epsilon
VGVREGEDLHVIDVWRYLGTARSEEEAWALLDGGLPAFDLDVYKILRKSLAGKPVVPLSR